MDLATRKRFLSGGIEAPAAKMAAVSHQDQLMSFADIMTVQLLNAVTNTEPIQRGALLDDLISRIQWLKHQHNEQEAKFKKPLSPDRAKEPSNQAFDPKQMQINIQKQIEMLQNMSKVFRYSAQLQISSFPQQNGQPVATTAASAIPPLKKTPTPVPSQPPVSVTIQPPAAPPSLPVASVSSVPIPPVTSRPPTMQPATIVVPEGSKKSPPLLPAKKQDSLGNSPKQLDTSLMMSTKQMTQTPEEYVIDLQNKQRKLLGYINKAHEGNVTDAVLRDYLKHPYVLLKEHGVVRPQPNPFFHLMNSSLSNVAVNMAQMVPPPIKMMTPTPVHDQKPVKSETPIPAPPVLVPQIELPNKKDPETPKKETSSPNEKVSPPPQLAPQTPLEKWVAPFEPPVTRQCNQWSVFSMALPLRLLCRCHPRPCTCQLITH